MSFMGMVESCQERWPRQEPTPSTPLMHEVVLVACLILCDRDPLHGRPLFHHEAGGM